MANTDPNSPPVYLPGVRNQPQPAPSPFSRTQQSIHRTPPVDRTIDPGDLQAMLMKRIMMAQGGNGAQPVTDMSYVPPPRNSASLFPGYSVYRCVDEEHKLMREIARTNDLGNADQFIISEQVVQALILDSNLTVVDLGKDGGGGRKINLVPIKTPPLSNYGTLYVEEGAVNRSSGRTLSGQPRRAGNLLID